MLGARACSRLVSLRAAVRSSSTAFAGLTRCSTAGCSTGILTNKSALCYSAKRYATQEAHASRSPPEKHEFQAETRMLLDIVAKSLYSEQEVFLRELISNASDALEKLRYIQLTSDEKLSVPGDHNYEIRITTDAKARTLVIQDTGIGMTKQELIDCLGTIARSGSKEFMQKLAEAKSSSTDSIIGQFGVGFYSAFMVADSVQVTTRSCRPDSPGYLWTSDGSGSYEISEQDDLPTGTTITLHMKAGDAAEFCNEERVKAVIDKYSAFVTVPILVNGTRVNSLNAIWTMDKKDVTSTMHEEFYKHITKGKHLFGSDDRPRYTLHYKTDSPINIRALLYVPSRKFNQFEFASDDQVDVALYARRILIKPSAKELVPRYLRFLAGVVDSEDIPLNLSREMLQMNEVIAKLRRVVSGRVIKFFLEEMKKDPVKYKEFYRDYGVFFKEGILLETDHTLREDLAKLLMFESSNFKAGTKTSLTEYVERMQADQKDIYYLYAPSRELAESSPYYEAVKSRNMEVLFLYEPHDELVFLALPQFQMKQTQSVEKWMQSVGDHKEDDSVIETMRDSDKKAFLKWVQLTLGSVKAASIKSTSRASNYPAIVTVADMGAARHFMRIGQIKDKEHLMMLKPTFEVNLSHPIIQKLMKMQKGEPKLAELIVEQLYDNALVTAGLMVDSRPMISRINEVLTELLTRDDGPRILTP